MGRITVLRWLPLFVLIFLARTSSAAEPGLASIDGDWTHVRPPGIRYGQVAVHDSQRGRMLIFGGSSDLTFEGLRNDVWALTLSGTPPWDEITPAGTPPVPVYEPAAMYDPVRDRLIVFGGTDGSVIVHNEVWVLSLSGTPTWSVLATSGTAPRRSGHSVIYDPAGDRMIVFGGRDSDAFLRNEVFALSLSGSPTWSTITPAGGPPGPRTGHGAIYDPVRGRMVVYAGSNNIGAYADVWALSLSGPPVWSAVTPSGTADRLNHTAIYDSLRDRMVVFGGQDNGFTPTDAVSAMTFSGTPAWSAITPAGTSPGARFEHTAIYDPVGDRMIAFAGLDSLIENDVWELKFSGTPTWTQIPPGGIVPRALEHAAIYDPVRERMIVFGGTRVEENATLRDDTWGLSLSGPAVWTKLAPTGTPPTHLYGHSAIYDRPRDRMVVFGGLDGTLTPYNQVRVLSLSGTPAWSALTPTGTPPVARYDHTAIYDPVRDRMVVYGGTDPVFAALGDVWTLSLSGTPTWTAINPTGTPPGPRGSHSAIYDPVRDRMVVFGGSDNQVWALSLSGPPAWSQITPAGTPLLIGHTAIYDPARDRMVVFGGHDLENGYNLVQAMSLSGTPAWSVLSPGGASVPGNRYAHTAVYDPVRDRMVSFGGVSDMEGVWALTWNTPVSSVGNVSVAPRIEMGPPRPNPFRSGTTLDFTLSSASPIVIEVIDVSGRRVRMMDMGALPTGRHSLSWDGTSDAGRRVPGGVYFMRMRGAGFGTSRKLVLLD